MSVRVKKHVREDKKKHVYEGKNMTSSVSQCGVTECFWR